MQLRHVVRALSRHHQVDVLVVRRGQQAYVERFGSARVLRVPVAEEGLDACVQTFRRALRRQIGGSDYDVVHCRDGWSGLTALELQSVHHFAMVFDAARSPMTEPPLADLTVATELERSEMSCVRRADMVLAPSEAARHHLSGLIEPAVVHTVPPGVDVNEFDWDEAPDVERPRVLFLGSLAPGRGVRVLLRAMLDVVATVDAELVLAGCGTPEFEESLVTAVEDLGLGDCVRLLGEVEHGDVPALIASAAVCVAPGGLDLEGRPTALYPTKLLEYMACQRAVVAPRRSAITLLLRDGQHGLIFEPGEPGALAEKIVALMTDSALRGRLARAGYELVRRVHTASGTRRELLRAYRWLESQDVVSSRMEASGGTRLGPYKEPEAAGVGTPAGLSAAVAGFEGEAAFSAADDTSSKGYEVGDDVTRVEANPIGADPEYGGADAGASTDEWVLASAGAQAADSAGESEAAPEPGPSIVTSSPADASVPVENRFVAGEVEASAPRPDLERPLVPVTAVLAPPGSVKVSVDPDLGADDDSLTDVARKGLTSAQGAVQAVGGQAPSHRAVSEATTKLIDRDEIDPADTLRAPNSRPGADSAESRAAPTPLPQDTMPTPQPDPKQTLRMTFPPAPTDKSGPQPSRAGSRRESAAEGDGD